MKDKLRQMQKAKRKAESSSHASESTAFVHVVKKGTARMKKERQDKENKRKKKNNPLRVVSLHSLIN